MILILKNVSIQTDKINAHMETLVELLHEMNNKSPDDLAPLIKKCNDISQCVTKIRAYADVALHRDVLL
jgi:ferritin-like protein